MTTNAINNQGMIEITSYITGDVIFEYRPTTEEIAKGIALRAAVAEAVRTGMSLAHAELADADLCDMDLTGANFDSAHLGRTKFCHAKLTGVNFNRANLNAADMNRANVIGATFFYADLCGTRMIGVDARGANFSGAYIFGTHLGGADMANTILEDTDIISAYLTNTTLTGAKWQNGRIIDKNPVQLTGLNWPITILGGYMQIGCEMHSLYDWSEFDDNRIIEMGGKEALRFWKQYKNALLALDPLITPSTATA